MIIHDITKNIADKLTHDPITRHASVYIGAIPEETELGELTIVVTPQQVTHERGAGRSLSVQLFIAQDDSRHVANKAVPEKTPGGYYIFGTGGAFDHLIEHIEHSLFEWDLGAIPTGTQIEYDYTAVPYNAAVITATFQCVETF